MGPYDGNTRGDSPLATAFGLTWYRESGQITHALATGIISAEGKLVTILEGNAWRPEDAVKFIRSVQEAS